jgi:hypothetical protein
VDTKCDCEHCGEHIAFPSEAAEQVVECPHCKCETRLSASSAETNQIVNCPCQQCGGAIEFDASQLVEENSLVQCPHCGLETKLFIPQDTPTATAANSENESELEAKIAAMASMEFLQFCADADRSDWSRLKAIRQKLFPVSTQPTLGGNKDFESVGNMRQAEITLKITIRHNQDTLTLLDDTVTIQKRGWANALASGMNGDRTIQVSSLTAVQMKPAGMITLGYILFSYAGSKPFMGGLWEATQDPDAFLFNTSLNGQVAKFKAQVEKKMRESKQPAPSPANNSSGTLTDELRKLAEFKQQGILSQAEFEAAKRKLLA